MPYFIRIGKFSGNKSKVGARGYHIYRRGTKVITVWGPVVVNRKKEVEFVWARRTESKVYYHRSERAAKATCSQLVEERIAKERYERLPLTAKIRRTSVSHPPHVRKS